MNQELRILAYMQEHGSITTKDAFEHCGITRLSARIYDLKQRGYRIVKIRETGINRYGEKTRFDRYKVINDER